VTVRLLRFVIAALAGAWVADAWLARRNGGAPPPIESLVVIDAPIDRVWAELADVEGQPRWMREMKSVRLLSDGPVGVGTRAEATVRILGVPVVDPVEVTGFTPPRHFAIRHEGTFSGHGIIALEPGADGTTTIVRWDETLIAPWLPQVWAVLSAPVLRHIFGTDLRDLRDLVEAAQ
jgi:uncharacterized protein YndB with AHSA1/START domain